MSELQNKVGMIFWQDLTVANADEVKDFYQAVVGWVAQPADMGGYNDYHMNAPGSGEGVTGICHARGVNADLPAAWLIYFNVADVRHSAAQCEARGGKVLTGPREMCGGLMCVIEDPAGAVCALCGPLDPTAA